MKSLVVPIGPDGPVLEIEISLGSALAHSRLTSGLVIPPPIQVPALIDTGADVTTLDPAVLTPLAGFGLLPTRYYFLNSPGLGGMTVVPEYHIGLTIGRTPGQPRSGLVLRSLPVIERALGNTGSYQALIGRDVLDRCAFFYDGPGRSVTLVM